MARLRHAGLVRQRTPTEISRYGGTRFKAPKGFDTSPGIRRALSRFKDVLTGTAGTVPTSEIALTKKESVKRGFRQVQGVGTPNVTLVPKFRGEQVAVRNKSIEYVSTEGTRVQRLELPPVRHDTPGHFFSDLKKINIKNLQQQYPGYMIGARFYNNRTELVSIGQLKYLLNKINAYDSVVAAHGRKQTADVLRNIELILVPPADATKYEADKKRNAKLNKKK